MVTLSRRGKTFVAASLVAVLFAGYLMTRLVGNSSGAPVEFSEARLQGALISQNIVALSQKAVQEIENISELDKEEKFEEAFERTTYVVEQSQEIRDKAVELAAELDKMTRALTSIDSIEARQASLEAINNWLALINRLINYSGYLGQLMDTLRNRFIGAPEEHEVTKLIGLLNAEVGAIDYFDNQARQAIERFDRLISE